MGTPMFPGRRLRRVFRFGEDVSDGYKEREKGVGLEGEEKSEGSGYRNPGI